MSVYVRNMCIMIRWVWIPTTTFECTVCTVPYLNFNCQTPGWYYLLCEYNICGDTNNGTVIGMVNNVLVIISARLLSCCAVYKRLLSQFFFFFGCAKASALWLYKKTDDLILCLHVALIKQSEKWQWVFLCLHVVCMSISSCRVCLCACERVYISVGTCAFISARSARIMIIVIWRICCRRLRHFVLHFISCLVCVCANFCFHSGSFPFIPSSI